MLGEAALKVGIKELQGSYWSSFRFWTPATSHELFLFCAVRCDLLTTEVQQGFYNFFEFSDFIAEIMPKCDCEIVLISITSMDHGHTWIMAVVL